MNVLINLISTGLVELQGMQSTMKLQNEKKNLAHSGIRTTNLLLTEQTR